jgi:hypothetical protein
MDQVPWIFSCRLQAGSAPRVSQRAPADAWGAIKSAPQKIITQRLQIFSPFSACGSEAR